MVLGMMATVPFLVYFCRNKRILLGIAFFILFLIPTFTPWAACWLVSERYLYLPVILFSFLAAEWWTESRIKTILIIILILLAYRTIYRNEDYRTPQRFWAQTVKTSPYSPRAHLELGKVYIEAGDNLSALKQFEIARKLHPGLADIWYNLGITQWLLGNQQLAIKAWDNAKMLDLDNPLYNILSTYAQNGLLEIRQGVVALKPQKGAE
jgi:tetratricopeptide (TPR) repeat protein